ncbi:hypothetical protein ALO62_01393 [Pseudomonas amygdali pv. myricae]|nr:hypothetical protein ALO62_01393 [Pseudomonas amygdali pv. myricae]
MYEAITTHNRSNSGCPLALVRTVLDGLLRALLRAGQKKGPASLQALDLYGAGTRSRTRDLLITSQLLYQLSYTGVMGCEYIASDALVKPSCLIQLKKIDHWRFGWDADG